MQGQGCLIPLPFITWDSGSLELYSSLPEYIFGVFDPGLHVISGSLMKSQDFQFSARKGLYAVFKGN